MSKFIGLLLIGAAFGSLMVPATSRNFRIPLRPYCAVMAILILVGGILVGVAS